MRQWMAVMLMWAGLILAGCGEQSSGEALVGPVPPAGGGGVAVLDLRTVGKRLGRDKQIQAAVQQRRTQLTQQLEAMRKDLAAQFQAKQKTLSDPPTDAQKKELLELDRQFKTRIAQARAEATQKLNTFQLKVNRQFQDQVRPVALAIAKENGASVVLLHDPDQTGFVFAREESVDITKPVVLTLLQKEVDAAKASGKGQTPAPSTPQIEVPKLNDFSVPKKK